MAIFKLNLKLQGINSTSSSEKMEALKCIQLLRADLKGFESVKILPEVETAPVPGEKGIGSLVIGVLSTEVQGEIVAVRVARSLLTSMQGKHRHGYKIQISKKRVDGSEGTITIEGPASSQQEMIAMLDKAEDFITRQA